jgi:hypothetical protein
MVEYGNIRFGVVLEQGDDIDASHLLKKCNLADYIDDRGYFDLVKFIGLSHLCQPRNKNEQRLMDDGLVQLEKP